MDKQRLLPALFVLASAFAAVCRPAESSTPAFDSSPARPASILNGTSRVAEQPYIERYPSADASSSMRSIEMVFIPGGAFTMGDSRSRQWNGEQGLPRHEVRISPFWMSAHEIPWELIVDWQSFYTRFSRVDQRFTDEEKAFLRLGWPGTPYRNPDFLSRIDRDHIRPATSLTQFNAQLFCQWLSLRTGRVYRLPTEAEWEYAARAGTNTTWYFGNDPARLSDHAWFRETLESGVRDIRLKKPNAWGLYDMYGNAAEWTLDGWADDPARPAARGAADPWTPRPPGSHFGVVRGGDWTSAPEQARSAARRKQDDTGSDSWVSNGMGAFDVSDEGRRVGFRIVSPLRRETDGREKSIQPLYGFLKPKEFERTK